jgi:hypothetical protein
LDKQIGKELIITIISMPVVARKYVENAVLQKGVPAEYFATGLLTVFSTAMNTKHMIMMDKSWGQYGILWIINMAMTGFRKSTCFKVVWTIAEDVIHSIQESNEINKKNHLKLRAVFDKDPVKNDPPDPAKKRMPKVDDVTYQYLTDLMSISPHGTTLSSDEVLGAIMGLSEMSKGSVAERSFILQCWDGVSGEAGRKGGGEIYVNHKHMNIFGFAQPNKFRKLLMTDENTDDGFLPRMLMVNIPERRMPRQNIDTDMASMATLKNAFAQLEGETPNYIGCGEKKVNPTLHHLSKEAQEYWQTLRTKMMTLEKHSL